MLPAGGSGSWYGESGPADPPGDLAAVPTRWLPTASPSGTTASVRDETVGRVGPLIRTLAGPDWLPCLQSL
jgi:hypothetical protein